MNARKVAIKAFSILRERGYIARANYKCCSGCASNQIARDVQENNLTPAGLVFWTKQDERTYREHKALFIRFSEPELCTTRSIKDVGQEIYQLLKELVLELRIPQSVMIDWNEDPESAICVRDC